MALTPEEEADLEEQEEEIQDAADRLGAALAAPVAPSPPLAPPSSRTSDASALTELLETLVLRVDQVAKTSAEQFARVESVNSQMIATMRLAQEMIAQQDLLAQAQQDQIDQLSEAVAALIKINANLTEIVAALLAPVQQKG